jgi:hypothetical protein
MQLRERKEIYRMKMFQCRIDCRYGTGLRGRSRQFGEQGCSRDDDEPEARRSDETIIAAWG